MMQSITNEWEAVIGLEVHVQLKTKSKIFSGASTAYGAAPNTQACAIDLGLPGVLPVLNEEVIRMAVKFGLASNSQIAHESVFDRKNYFYPDLPKGYQISQFQIPIVHSGYLDINVNNIQKRIGITRAHLEEDAGKSLHEDFHGYTGIDLNRAGTPLLEIVSEPELCNSDEAVAYLKALHSLVCYLDICDGNMQEGSFRCDANVSVRRKGDTKLGTRTETKNVNSFKFVEQAIQYEIKRQINRLENGEVIHQETRLFDPDKQETRVMRTKEEANDYRYFPDPDLLPVEIDQNYIENIRKTLPELPQKRRERFIKEFGLSEYDADVLISSRILADYYEQTLSITNNQDPKLVANWITSELLGALNKANLNISQCFISADNMGGLLNRILDNTISGKMAKTVFDLMLKSNGEQSADHIIQTQGLKQVTDLGAIENLIDEIIQNNPTQVEQYKSGKDKLFGFFVGQAMKLSEGKVNPAQLNELLKKKLS